jgi:predicted tellurium resistance membrane protein TerC
MMDWILASASAAATTAPAVYPLLSVEALLALVTLTAMEIVLGIDNVVFISILVNKLPAEKRDIARKIGLGLAMGIRILLLFSIYWIMKLTYPLFSIPAFWTSDAGDALSISGKDLVLIVGGAFLLWKATHELHNKLEGESHHAAASAGTVVAATFGWTIAQILLLDIVFSLDSVITAVGMAQHIEVMVAAVVIAVGVMMVFSGAIAGVINKHPTLQVLALSFLLLIGVMLIVEGLHVHVPKGYIYFAMAFSVGVEMLNIFASRKRGKPVELHKPTI